MVVVGFIVRDVGPLFWRRIGAESSRDVHEQGGHWRALCHGIAAALTAGGVVVLLVTIAAVLLGLSDSVGSITVLIASIVGIAVAVVLSARITREYRRGDIRALPVHEVPKRSAQPASRGLSTQSTGPLAAQPRRESKSADRLAEISPTVVNLPPPPAEDEPFDVNRLLPEEFHHEYGELDEPTAVPLVATDQAESSESDSDAGVTVETDTEEPSKAAEIESVEAVDESNSTLDGPAIADVVGDPPALPSGMSGFQSPLLADIAADAEDRPFSSRLLADVDPDAHTDTVTYQSPLLANLLLERNERPDEESAEGKSDSDEPIGTATDKRT
jgi:hypothetical protein